MSDVWPLVINQVVTLVFVGLLGKLWIDRRVSQALEEHRIRFGIVHPKVAETLAEVTRELMGLFQLHAELVQEAKRSRHQVGQRLNGIGQRVRHIRKQDPQWFLYLTDDVEQALRAFFEVQRVTYDQAYAMVSEYISHSRPSEDSSQPLAAAQVEDLTAGLQALRGKLLDFRSCSHRVLGIE